MLGHPLVPVQSPGNEKRDLEKPKYKLLAFITKPAICQRLVPPPLLHSPADPHPLPDDGGDRPGQGGQRVGRRGTEIGVEGGTEYNFPNSFVNYLRYVKNVIMDGQMK